MNYKRLAIAVGMSNTHFRSYTTSSVQLNHRVKA